MGRPPTCTCGDVKLWTGAVQSADNSQHLADWYTPSHIIHGFLFYFLGWLFLRRNPFGDRFLAAVAIEAGWEMLENSKWRSEEHTSDLRSLMRLSYAVFCLKKKTTERKS